MIEDNAASRNVLFVQALFAVALSCLNHLSMRSQAAMKGGLVIVMMMVVALLVSDGASAQTETCPTNNVCSNRNVPDGCPCINGCGNCLTGANCGVQCIGGAVNGNVCACGRP